MLLGEPPRTQADLNFTVFGIPVRVHPFFWLVALLLGIRGDEAEPVRTFIWVAAVFFSILIHELGHALAARRYGWQPWITLHGIGGLASYNPTHHEPRSRILIAAAGPAAGFGLAALVLAAVYLSGHRFTFVPSIFPIRFESLYANPRLNALVFDLLWINILWGVINLFPIYPLDGGQIAREILVERNPREGVRQSLWLSIVAAAGLAVYALTSDSIFMTVMFGYLAYSSYTTLQAYRGRGGGIGW